MFDDAREELLDYLKLRRENVDAGLEVEGIKFQSLNKLIIKFEHLSTEYTEECRGLVGELANGNLEPAWEVEV